MSTANSPGMETEGTEWSKVNISHKFHTTSFEGRRGGHGKIRWKCDISMRRCPFGFSISAVYGGKGTVRIDELEIWFKLVPL